MTESIYISKWTFLIQGDVIDALKQMDDRMVQCVITSPPYWGLRDYGVKGQLGLEPMPEEYVEKMVEVFREVHRVLRDDGTLWLNLGDCYASGGRGSSDAHRQKVGINTAAAQALGRKTAPAGLKDKDLVGIPWRVALALQADGWYLRSDIIWAKSNPMPESVTDRPTRAHEYLFLLTKSARYFYDADAIRESSVEPHRVRSDQVGGNKGAEIHYSPGGIYTQNPQSKAGISKDDYDKRKWVDRSDGLSRPPMTMNDREYNPLGRNKRTVWTIPTQPFPQAHFATFPFALVEPCVLAGTSAKGCCAKCGAPWRRIIEKVDTGKTQKMADGWATHKGGHGSFHREGREQGEEGKPVMASRTTGWQMICTCSEHEPIDCRVLDPFCGSGTVGVVALKHGRRFVGIDLNEEYLKTMAMPRLKAAEAEPIPQELF